jgi:hypothetical protein
LLSFFLAIKYAGVDPAEYARGLMNAAAVASKVHLQQPVTSPDVLVRVLTDAWERTHVVGSATAFIGCVQPSTKKLFLANLGDSGCVVLRRLVQKDTAAAAQFEVAFHTQEQQVCEIILHVLDQPL